VGEVIVATWRPHEVQVLEAIQELGLELQIIFNKDAVMVLPSGVNKKSGLCAAVDELRLSPHNVHAIGDAENDHAFLESCECPIAVANAIPALKAQAALVTAEARGEGVCEIIARLLENDLADVEGMRARNRIAIGSAAAEEVSLPAYGRAVLVWASPGAESRLSSSDCWSASSERKYQTCLVDPEGDYENLSGFRTLAHSDGKTW
jgi:haloacid dehalogenase-like hydrolase